MEATGVYYESLAYYLVEGGLKTHVLLPNTSKHFFGSLNAKSKTDKDDGKKRKEKTRAARIVEKGQSTQKRPRLIKTETALDGNTGVLPPSD